MTAADAEADETRGRSARRAARMKDLGGTDDHVVMYFKERIYATFTGLAIVLVAAASDHPTAAHAAVVLVLGVLGITAAGFVSDIISHLSVHQEFPSAKDLAILLRVAGGALSTMVTPLILIGLAALEVWDIDTALIASICVYVATLALVGWFAVRRSNIIWWKQLLALVMLVILGLLVVLLQTLAHSE
jgi:hypothetical protein